MRDGAEATLDTSPAGRQVTSTLDPQGRVLSTQVTGLAPITFAYDPRGRLSTLTHNGGRCCLP